ncbi:hypothetical protein [Actinomadura sp. DC4]|uniref:hypothetical protein n=1 Tax=Actinomadura sp. DC4 TaxID=3055069 RepID=UPI0025B13D8C|nr:hypothetical protein [Actinomadura sp. DC4]MDN3357289.1 hypothetical protein [Actinomadura sp. DC4]
MAFQMGVPAFRATQATPDPWRTSRRSTGACVQARTVLLPPVSPDRVTVWFDEGSAVANRHAVARIAVAAAAVRDLTGRTGPALRVTATGFGNGFVRLPRAGDRLRDQRARSIGEKRAKAVLALLRESLKDLERAGRITFAPATSGGREPDAAARARRRVEIAFEPAEPRPAGSAEPPAGLVPPRTLTALIGASEAMTAAAAGTDVPIPPEVRKASPPLRALERNRVSVASRMATVLSFTAAARAMLAGADTTGSGAVAGGLHGAITALDDTLEAGSAILRLQDTVAELRRLLEAVAPARTRRQLEREIRLLESEGALDERASEIRERIEDAVVRHQAELALREERRASARRTAETVAAARNPTPQQVAGSLEQTVARRAGQTEVEPDRDGDWAQRLAYYWLVHQRAQEDVALLGLDPAARRAKRAELRALGLALGRRLAELLRDQVEPDASVERELAGPIDALRAAIAPIEKARRSRAGASPWEITRSTPVARYELPAYLRGSLGPELVRSVAPEAATAFADEVVALLPTWLRAHYTDRVRARITADWLIDNWGHVAGGTLTFDVGPFKVTLWAETSGGTQLGDEIHVRPKHTTALTTGSRAGRVHFFMSDGTLNVAWALDSFAGKHLGALDLHGHDAFAGVATWGWADHYEKPQSGYGMRIDQTVKGSTYRSVPFGMSVQAFAKVELTGVPGVSWVQDNTGAAPIVSDGVELAVSREVLYPLNAAALAASRSVFPGRIDGRWEPVPASLVARDEPVRLPRWSWVQAFEAARALAAAVATAIGAKPGSELERRVQRAITAETVVAAFPLARSRHGWEIVLDAPRTGPNSVTVRFEFTNPGLVLRGDDGTWADYAQTLVTYQDVVTAHADMIDIPPTLMFAALQLYHGKPIGEFDPGFQLLTYAMPWIWREAVRVTSGLSGEANELSSVRLVGEPTALIAVKTRAVIEVGRGKAWTALDLPRDTTIRVLDRDLRRWFGDELTPLLKQPSTVLPEPPLKAPEDLKTWWPAWMWIAEVGESLENIYQPLVDQINQRYPGALPYPQPNRPGRWVTSPIAEANLRALKRALSAEQLATGLPRMRTTGVPITLQWKQYAGLTRQVYVWLRAHSVGEARFQHRMPDGEQDFFTINTHDLTGSSEQIWGSWWGLQFTFALGALGVDALKAVEFRPILAARLAKTLGITSGHVLWSLFGAAIDDIAVFDQGVRIEASISADPVPDDPTARMPGAYPMDGEEEWTVPDQHVIDGPAGEHVAVPMEREDPNVQVTDDGRVIATDDITFTMPVQLTSRQVTGDDGQAAWVPFDDMAGDRPAWTAESGPEWPDQSVLLPHLGGVREEIERAFAERFGVDLPASEQVRLADAIQLLAGRIQDLQQSPAEDEGGWPIWEGKAGFRAPDVLHGRWGDTGASVRARARVVRAETVAPADGFGAYNEYGSLDLHGLYEESGRGWQGGLRVRFPIGVNEHTTLTPQPQLLRRAENNNGSNEEISGTRSRMTLDVSTGTSFLLLGRAYIEFDFILAVDDSPPDPRPVTVTRAGWFVHSSEQADELGMVPAHRKTPQGTEDAAFPGARVKQEELYAPSWLLDGEHGIGNAGVYRSPRTRELAKKIYNTVKKAWGHHVAAELDKELVKALSSAGAVAVVDGGLAFDVPLSDHFPLLRTASLRVVLKGRLTDPGYQGISLDRFYSGFQVGGDRTKDKTRDRRVRWALDARGWVIRELHPTRGGDPNSFWYNHTYSYGTQNERTRTESDSAESKVSHTGNDNSGLFWFGVDYTVDIELSKAPVLLFDLLTLGLLQTSRSLRVEHSQRGRAARLHLDPYLLTSEPPPKPGLTVLPPPARLPKVLDRRVPRTLSDDERRSLGATPPQRLPGTGIGDLIGGYRFPADVFRETQIIGLPGLDVLQGLAGDLMGAPGGESWFYAWGDVFRQLTSTLTQAQLSGRSAELFGAEGFTFSIREPGRFGGYLGKLTLAVSALEYTFDTTTPEVMIRDLRNRASVVRSSGGRSKVTFHSPWALVDFQVGGRPIDGNNAAGPFAGVDHLGADTTVMADRGTKTMLERGPKTTGRNVTLVGVKPTYLLVWKPEYRAPWFVRYTPDVDAANGVLLRVPTERLGALSGAPWHGDRSGPPATRPGPDLIEGDYATTYPDAYRETALRHAETLRATLPAEVSPAEGRQVLFDAAVNERMERHFGAALRHAGIVDVSMPRYGDCFFETALTAPRAVRDRLREVLGAEPTVAAMRAHMADFLAADLAFAAGHPSAAPVAAAWFMDIETEEARARYVEDVRRMGSYDNEASDRVPELFSLIFGIPLDVWQPRYRHPIGWTPERDPGTVPMPLIRRGSHYYFGQFADPSRQPTLLTPARPRNATGNRLTTGQANTVTDANRFTWSSSSASSGDCVSVAVVRR